MENSSEITEANTETSPQRIFALLKRLVGSNISITIGGSATNYTSSLLKINYEKSYLLLDELKPLPNAKDVKKGALYRIQASTENITMDFTVPLLTTTMKNEVLYFATAIPKIVNYDQKRYTFRISTVANFDIKVEMRWPNGPVEEARLHDISITGLSFLTQTPPPTMEEDEIPPMEVIVYLPELDAPMRCRVIVKNIRQIDRRFIIGTSFELLPLHEQRVVERFVAKLDRLQRRESAG